jgi:hypothetical protein
MHITIITTQDSNDSDIRFARGPKCDSPMSMALLQTSTIQDRRIAKKQIHQSKTRRFDLEQISRPTEH